MRTKARRFLFEAATWMCLSPGHSCSSGRSCAVRGYHVVGADERNDYLAFPGIVRIAPSFATWTANRLAGSLALAFSLTK